MALAGREIREGHAMTAADFCVHVMDLAGKAIRWKPFGHGVGIQKGTVNSFSGRAENTVESNCVWHILYVGDERTSLKLFSTRILARAVQKGRVSIQNSMISSSTVRHWVSGVLIVIAVGMVVLGQTVFVGRLKDYDYVFYWGACMLVTLLAAFAAIFDLAAIRRQSRREHHRLVEDTFKNVDPGNSEG